MIFCARSASFHSAGFSISAFSSLRRSFAASQSKMPPYQGQGFADVINNGLRFGTHVRLPDWIESPDAVTLSEFIVM